MLGRLGSQQCHNGCGESIEADWNYCVKCGVPLRQPCPYSEDHYAPIIISPQPVGRCPMCDLILRYCPECHRLSRIQERFCTHHPKPVPLSDFHSGYVTIGGSFTGQGSTYEPGFRCTVGSASREAPLEYKISSPILPPISAYGFVYFFALESNQVQMVSETLDEDSARDRDPLGAPSSECKGTNLAAACGLIGVLLDERAVLLSADALNTVREVPGRFGTQLFIGDDWYLFGEEGGGGIRLVRVDTKKSETEAPVSLDGLSRELSRPITDGESVLLVSTDGRLYRSNGGGEFAKSAQFAEGKVIGQPAVVGGSVWVLCGQRQLVRVSRTDRDSKAMKLPDDVTLAKVCGVSDMLTVAVNGGIQRLDARHGKALDKIPRPATCEIVDLHMVQFKDELVTLFHEKDRNYHLFHVAVGNRVDPKPITEDMKLAGFIYANGGLFVWGSGNKKSSIKRRELGVRD